jgi:hypothetical protein
MYLYMRNHDFNYSLDWTVLHKESKTDNGCCINSCNRSLNLIRSSVSAIQPLKIPTLGILVAEEGNVLGQQTGLWSTEAKA